jgi:hypothetical protein
MKPAVAHSLPPSAPALDAVRDFDLLDIGEE